MSAARLGIGLIGVGKSGPIIASSLRAAGHEIIGVAARSAEAVERADAFLPGVPVLSIEEIVAQSELVLLALPDEEIAPLVAGLAELGAWKMGTILVHLAGPYGTGILAPAHAQGAIPVAIHPTIRFTGWSVDLQRLTGAPFLVTAPGPFLPIAQALVVEMGGEPIIIEEDARPGVHAALTLGVNGIAMGVIRAFEALKAQGIEEPSLIAGPLFGQTTDVALSEGEAAIAAPITRADAEVVRSHVKALAALGDDALNAYEAGVRDAVTMLLCRARLNERDADAVRSALLEG